MILHQLGAGATEGYLGASIGAEWVSRTNRFFGGFLSIEYDFS